MLAIKLSGTNIGNNQFPEYFLFSQIMGIIIDRVMDCLQCPCNQKDQQRILQVDQAKAIFHEAQMQMNRSSVQQLGLRGRDERRSLKRPANCSFPEVQGQALMAVSNYPKEQLLPLTQRPVSLPVYFEQSDNQNSKMRFSQPPQVYSGFNPVQNQAYPQLFAPKLQQKLQQQSATISKNSKQYNPCLNILNLPTPQTFQPIPGPNSLPRRTPVNQKSGNQVSVMKLNVPPKENYYNQPYISPQQIVDQQFRNDLDQVRKQEAARARLKTQPTETSSKQLNIPQMLEPAIETDAHTERMSRPGSAVRNLDDIACTKTQSIGDESDSSSQFSEIVYSLDSLHLNKKKMTNSSINFIIHEEIAPALLSQNLVSKKKSSRQSCINK